jgi:ankyrin repeat protein
VSGFIVCLFVSHSTLIPVVAVFSFECVGLHYATLSGHLQAVRFLLSNGADVEAKDREGCTPLLLATIYGHVFIASMLLDHGAQIEAAGMHGQTPLHKVGDECIC